MKGALARVIDYERSPHVAPIIQHLDATDDVAIASIVHPGHHSDRHPNGDQTYPQRVHSMLLSAHTSTRDLYLPLDEHNQIRAFTFFTRIVPKTLFRASLVAAPVLCPW